MRRVLWLFGLSLLGACAQAQPAHGNLPDLNLRSPAFSYGERIPVRYTCDGEDLSPPLVWDAPPPGTQALVLIADDPDAPRGTWVHWVLYDIPPTATQLAEGASLGQPGRNSWGRTGFVGPCPPPGKPHRYFFRLYALDTLLNLPPGADKAQVERAMQGHILAQGEWMGTYGR